jgi:polysaccharide biosynthesis protein PslH
MYSNFRVLNVIPGPVQMKILFLTAHLPFPPSSGGRRREFELVSRLGQKFEIHLCSLTLAQRKDDVNARHLYRYCKSVSLFKVVNPPPFIHCNMTHPWLMKRYYSEEGINRISHLLNYQDFDIVHVEGYYLMQLLPRRLNVPVLLVEHNMEYMLNSQRYLLSRSPHDRFFNWQEYHYTLLWERSFWKRATKVVTLTTEDEIGIRRLDPNIDVRTIPNGIDHSLMIEQIAPIRNTSNAYSDTENFRSIEHSRHSVLFVCNFAYDPNIDAALYFVKQIFPSVLREVPDARLFLVGNCPPAEIRALSCLNNSDKNNSNSLEVTGYVESLYPFYRAAKVVVCPLRIGGGVKVKVLEALKAGKAIVCTSIGAQGLGVINNGALCVCDKASDFAKNIVRFLVSPRERHLQEENALSFARTLPTWNQVKEEYVRCYNEMTFVNSNINRHRAVRCHKEFSI